MEKSVALKVDSLEDYQARLFLIDLAVVYDLHVGGLPS